MEDSIKGEKKDGPKCCHAYARDWLLAQVSTNLSLRSKTDEYHRLKADKPRLQTHVTDRKEFDRQRDEMRMFQAWELEQRIRPAHRTTEAFFNAILGIDIPMP